MKLLSDLKESATEKSEEDRGSGTDDLQRKIAASEQLMVENEDIVRLPDSADENSEEVLVLSDRPCEVLASSEVQESCTFKLTEELDPTFPGAAADGSFQPSPFQEALLQHVAQVRERLQHSTGLVVMATALGKTIFAILDMSNRLAAEVSTDPHALVPFSEQSHANRAGLLSRRRNPSPRTDPKSPRLGAPRRKGTPPQPAANFQSGKHGVGLWGRSGGCPKGARGTTQNVLLWNRRILGTLLRTLRMFQPESWLRCLTFLLSRRCERCLKLRAILTQQQNGSSACDRVECGKLLPQRIPTDHLAQGQKHTGWGMWRMRTGIWRGSRRQTAPPDAQGIGCAPREWAVAAGGWQSRRTAKERAETMFSFSSSCTRKRSATRHLPSSGATSPPRATRRAPL